MAGRKKNKFFDKVFENVEISGFAAEGKAICRINDIVVFVKQAAPGDIVDLKITKARRNYLEGSIIKTHKESSMRTQAFCEHFGTCGGCKWQHLKYEKQLEFKQQQVVDSIERIGKIPNTEFELIPISGSKEITFYRNKLEYTFTDKRWLTSAEVNSDVQIKEKRALGFHVPGFFDKVMNINKCYLQPEPSNEIRNYLKEYAINQDFEFYNIRENQGWLRNVVIRNNLKGEFMVNLVVTEENDELQKLLNDLASKFNAITSLFYTINNKKNSSISDLQPVLHKGDAYLQESIGSTTFQIGPNSFFQTNSVQANVLYSIAKDFAGLEGSETVYDLYTGAGTIACYVASNAKKVIGIEYVEEAIIHAKENAALNNINNTEFYCGDMSKILTNEFINDKGRPDVIITDPPRAGMHPDVVEQIINSGAEKIIYVSCNPATQARDINILSKLYKLEKLQAVDMFPHTQHVESVAMLRLRK